MKFVRIVLPALTPLFWSSAARAILVTQTFSFSSLNQAVPDGVPTGLTNQQTVSSSIQSLTSVSVSLQVSGGFNGDLYSYVSSGTNIAVLLNRVGRTASNSAGYSDSGLNVTFSDSAANGDIHSYRNVTFPGFGAALTGTWQPDERNVNPFTVIDTSPRSAPLASFNGTNPSGTWTLFLADLNSASAAPSASTLASWSLQLQGQAFGSMTFDSDTATSGIQDGAGVWNASSQNWSLSGSDAAWSNTVYDTASFGSAKWGRRHGHGRRGHGQCHRLQRRLVA